MAKVLSSDLLRVKPKNGSQELKIVLPLGVSVNKLYTMFRGRKQISNEGKKYIRTVVPVIMQNIKNQGWEKDAKGVWHVVEITYYFPDRKKRDASNYLKLMLDVLEGLVYENDQFVRVHEKYVGLDRENPRMEIKIRHCWEEDLKYEKKTKESGVENNK